ncbi:MAG: hypothetical protein ABII10_02935 [Candidatus Paceibacterota bacterium]
MPIGGGEGLRKNEELFKRKEAKRVDKDFNSLAEVLAYFQENPQIFGRVSIKLSFTVGAKLSKNLFDNSEQLLLKIENEQGISQRSIEGSHSVSADPKTGIVGTINIEIGDYYKDPLFDRGLVHLHPGYNQLNIPASLSFFILKGDRSSEELEAGFARLKKEAERVLKNLSGADVEIR